VALYYR